MQRIITNAPTDVAVLKDPGVKEIKSILVPWGGGSHAQLGLEFAVRIDEATGTTIHLLRIAGPDVDREGEWQALTESVESIVGGYDQIHYQSQPF